MTNLRVDCLNYPVCADILHGLPTPGAGMADHEGVIHGFPQRHKAGPAEPGESAVQSTCIPAAAAATVGSTMKAADTAHLLGELFAVNDVPVMALSCNIINCWHGQPDAGAYICSCYNAWLLHTRVQWGSHLRPDCQSSRCTSIGGARW